MSDVYPVPKTYRAPKKPKGLKSRNEDRSKAQFAKAFHSEEYVEFVHSLGCAVPGCNRTNIQCAHVGPTRRNGGMWYEIVPLCGPAFNWKGHHAEQEGRTEQFNAEYGIELIDIAAATALRFKERYQP